MLSLKDFYRPIFLFSVRIFNQVFIIPIKDNDRNDEIETKHVWIINIPRDDGEQTYLPCSKRAIVCKCRESDLISLHFTKIFYIIVCPGILQIIMPIVI